MLATMRAGEVVQRFFPFEDATIPTSKTDADPLLHPAYRRFDDERTDRFARARSSARHRWDSDPSTGALKAHDGQMRPRVDVGDHKASRSHLRASFRWSALTPRRHLLRANLQHVARRPPGEPLVRPMLVVPDEVRLQLAREKAERHRHDDPCKRLVLHRPDEALDESDAAVRPDRAKRGLMPRFLHHARYSSRNCAP